MKSVHKFTKSIYPCSGVHRFIRSDRRKFEKRAPARFERNGSWLENPSSSSDETKNTRGYTEKLRAHVRNFDYCFRCESNVYITSVNGKDRGGGRWEKKRKNSTVEISTDKFMSSIMNRCSSYFWLWMKWSWEDETAHRHPKAEGGREGCRNGT